jgi:hypothetical protein
MSLPKLAFEVWPESHQIFFPAELPVIQADAFSGYETLIRTPARPGANVLASAAKSQALGSPRRAAVWAWHGTGFCSTALRALLFRM